MFKKVSKRTDKQNRAMHKLFSDIASELNREGYDVRLVLQVLAEKGADIQWTGHLVKEVWRALQIMSLGKTSTTELDSIGDINIVYEAINKFLGENFAIHKEFPSLENLMKKYETDN